jgi:hypothetical protein
MIMIDGMPIVSGLSSVYGLSGIPNALIERVEIVKGPASSLYGSEAVGGLINIITKKPQNAAAFSGDIFSTSWGELNTDLGFKFKAGKTAEVLTGVNYFKYGNRIDNNKDLFTDVTLQDRISVFQKWNFNRKENRQFSLAARYNYEDRWGGDVTWDKSYRGGTLRYGESIYTNRWEMLGTYQLPIKEPVMFSWSLNDHDQNSVYGNTIYKARQKVAFGQLSWDKKIKNHDLLFGSALRYTFYDDNTPATALPNGLNNTERVWLPGIFVQDEIALAASQGFIPVRLGKRILRTETAPLAAIAHELGGRPPAHKQAVRALASQQWTPHGVVDVRLLLDVETPEATAKFAREGWSWPPPAKQVRVRIDRGAASECSASRRAVVDRLESWSPTVTERRAEQFEDWMVLLTDEVEISEGLFVYLRHMAHTLALRHGGGAASSPKLLGLALGTPQRRSASDASEPEPARPEEPARGSLAVPSTCGTAYGASAWRQLRRYAAVAAASDADGSNCATVAPASWDSLQRRFMNESGFRMAFSGLHLCRHQGDATIKLASGEEVAAALQSGILR